MTFAVFDLQLNPPNGLPLANNKKANKDKWLIWSFSTKHDDGLSNNSVEVLKTCSVNNDGLDLKGDQFAHCRS